jgi:hypothetical protein
MEVILNYSTFGYSTLIYYMQFIICYFILGYNLFYSISSYSKLLYLMIK